MPWGGLVSSVLHRARAGRRLHQADEEGGRPPPTDWSNGKCPGSRPSSPEHLLPLTGMIQKWRSAVHHNRGETGAPATTEAAVDPGENGEVCLVIKSPYRILRCAGSGNLKVFRELHQDDPKRLEFRDAQRGRAPVHYAAANDQTEIIKYIASVDGDLNAVDNEGQTPLHLAVESASLAAITCLIESGAATDVLDSALRSPLHLAVTQDQPDVLRLLARHSDKVDCKQLSEHGRDALHIAAVLNRAECARVLLDDFGMKPCNFCNNGFTPIHEAARRASFATMQVFTNWGESQGCGGERMMLCPDIEGNLPLHLAVHSGDVKAVELCLRFGAKISSQQNDLSTPVHLACVQGSLEITQMLFDAQPNEKWTVLNLRDSSDMTPLHCAAKFDHALLVEYLSTQGADLNVLDSEERTPLMVAVLRSSWSAARTLLKLGAEADIPDLGGRNLLHFLVMNSGRVDDLISACSSGQQAFARMINEPDGQGCTPLHYASRHGHIRCLQRLMDLGACPNVKDANNESPLHFAARYGRYNTVRSLLSSRKGQFIINGIDSAGRTPLHIASENGYSRVVQLLISRGALLNRDFQGLTPLHLAAREGYTRTMDLLLATHTHLLDQRDKTGCTALHWACLANKPSAINLLLSLNCALLPNNEGSTAMDFCIKHKLVEAARAMLTSATSSERVLSDVSGKYKSIVSALIETMPKVLEDVMDRHISFANCKKDSELFFIKYNLAMFEPGEKRIQAIRDSRGDSKWRPEPLREVNHMVHHGRIDLLMHPLTQRYLAMKWQAYGRFCHLFSLLLYAIFVFLVTINAMNLMTLVRHCPVLLDVDGSVLVYKDGRHVAMDGDQPDEGEDVGANCDIRGIIHSKKSLWYYVIMVSVIVFGILNLLKKMMQMWNQSWNFVTDFENYMELAMYVSALISVTPVFYPLVTHCHIITSAITVFLAWFSMLLYLRSFESVGIYVVMFVEIQKTLLRVLIIFSVLIIAFGLSFYILLSNGNHPEFSSVPMSLARTFNMMLGEIDFLTVYVYPWLASPGNSSVSTLAPQGGGRRGGFRTEQVAASGNLSTPVVPISGLGQRFLPFANTSFLLVTIFMVMMPILLMNLLVGLAVGDIEAVRKNAALKRLAMQVDLHTGLERKLPQAFLDRVKRTELIEYPNTAVRLKESKASPLRKLAHFILYLVTPSHGSQMKTFDYLEHAAIAEQNHQHRELDKVKRRLKETSRTVEAVHKLMRLVIVKLEIGMEAEDEDEGGDAEHELLNMAPGSAAGGGGGGSTGGPRPGTGLGPGLLTVPARPGSRMLSPTVSQRRPRSGSRRRALPGGGGGNKGV